MNYIDLLATTGQTSAHPGGFQATMDLLRKHPLPPRSRVLEVGCGLGRTASYLAKQGHEVTAVDNHPGMLELARIRASQEGVRVEFAQADARQLPFAASSFDVVFVESVTNFSRIPAALREYARVLRKGGLLYDREIVRKRNGENLAELTRFYGIPEILHVPQWHRFMETNKLKPIRTLRSNRIHKNEAHDPLSPLHASVLQNPEALQQLASIGRLHRKYSSSLENVVFIARKQGR